MASDKGKINQLRISSFNCRGLKNSVNDIVELCNTSDILLLQEIWLCNDELSLLNEYHADFHGKGVSPVNTENGLISGCPHGGVAILWRKSLGKCCKFITYEGEKRIIGLKINCENEHDILVLNVYLPYMCTENRYTYLEHLGQISAIVQDAATSNVMVLGDFNAGINTYFYARWRLEHAYLQPVIFKSPVCI